MSTRRDGSTRADSPEPRHVPTPTLPSGHGVVRARVVGSFQRGGFHQVSVAGTKGGGPIVGAHDSDQGRCQPDDIDVGGRRIEELHGSDSQQGYQSPPSHAASSPKTRAEELLGHLFLLVVEVGVLEDLDQHLNRGLGVWVVLCY